MAPQPEMIWKRLTRMWGKDKYNNTIYELLENSKFKNLKHR